MANPDLARLITEAVGDGWVTDLSQLHRLLPLAEDAAFRARFRKAKQAAKVRFVNWLKEAAGVAVEPNSIFDSQIKRIHEYKRQLLNILHVVVLYNRLRADPKLDGPAAHLLLRRQGGAGVPPGQTDHQAHQQRRAGDRRRPGGSRTPQGGLRAQLQRVAGGAADSGQRRVRANLDGRV